MRAYLDYNATTPVDPLVLEAMLPYLGGEFGNASSIHTPGQRARAAVEEARESVAGLIGAKPAEVVFTSGGTESDNLAVFGVAGAFRQPGAAPQRGTRSGDSPHIITTTIEHHAVLHACQAIEEQGIEVTYVSVGANGIVDPGKIRQFLRPNTVLVSVMHTNNELGTIQPIEKIAAVLREARAAGAKVLFHCDAVQAAGKLPLDVNRLGVDLLSLSAHKFYGPKGAGALYVRSGRPIEPQFRGGHHERDRRPGTENVAGIAGMGRAAQLAAERLEQDAARMAALRERFERELLRAVPAARLNGDPGRRACNTTNIAFASAGGESLVIALDLQGVACSTGAACSSGAVEPSHVLLASGLSLDEARSSVRFSLGRCTTDDEVDYALSVIPRAVERLRAISPRPILAEASA